MSGHERTPSVPAATRSVFDLVMRLTDAVCRDYLNEEYAELSRELAAVLARKRPSPLLQGTPEVWACGITYAIGAVNFLFDPAQRPHLEARALCKLFGVSGSSGSRRSAQIMRLLHIIPLDPRWCTRSNLANNPLAWMIEVNGLVIDARMAPREVQREAYRRGLIPFMPE